MAVVASMLGVSSAAAREAAFRLLAIVREEGLYAALFHGDA